MKRLHAAAASLALAAFACSGAPPGAAVGPAAAVARAGGPTPPALRIPAGVVPVRVAATLTLVPKDATIDGTIDIDLRVDKATDLLWLNATELTIGAATLTAGGVALTPRVVSGNEDFVGFAFDRPLPVGPAKLHVVYKGKVVDNDDRGVFREAEGDATYLYSQFENTEARRAFPCFDEPSFKVPWQLTIKVKKADVAVSNTPAVSDTVEGDFHVVRFAETKPLPSYLVAFAVGPFEIVDAGKAGRNHVPLRIIAPKGKRAAVAFAAASTGKIIDLLEDYFDVPYPYEKMDVVPVLKLASFGAMENAGLITIGGRAAIAEGRGQSVEFERYYVDTMAHELAHQWFGDLVTMAFWDDVWLNEAFATWMGNKITQRYHPEWRYDIARIHDAQRAMGDDSLVSARRIRQEIKTKDDIQNAFDAITYEKGATVIGMFEAYLGPDKFRKGIQRYLARHAFGNATSEEFLADLGEGAGQKIGPAFASFLNAPGVPLVTPEVACDKKQMSVRFQSKRYLPIGSTDADKHVWSIPICARAGGETRCTLADGTASAALTFPVSGKCPVPVVGNASGLGYYHVKYGPADLDAVLGVGSKATPGEKVTILGDAAALVASGDLKIADALSRVPVFARDPDPKVLEGVVALAAVRRAFVADDLRPAYAAFVEKNFSARARELGFATKPGESADVHVLRNAIVPFVAIAGEDPVLEAEAKVLAGKWLADAGALDDDSVAGVLAVACRHGDRALFDRIHAEAKKTTDARRREHLIRALTSFHDPALLRDAQALFLTGEFDVRDSLALILGIDYEVLDPSFAFIKEHFDAIASRIPSEYRPEILGAAEGFCDAKHKADATAFLKDKAAKITGGARRLDQALETISVCIARRSAMEESLRGFLARK